MSKLVLRLAGTNSISNAPVYVEILDTELETIAELAILINKNEEIQLEPGKYLIKLNLPSGQVIKKVFLLENKLNEVVLPLLSSTNQLLEWHEFLGNAYTWTTERKYPQIPSIWQRLWSYEQKIWKAERLSTQLKLPQNQIPVNFSLKLLPQNKLLLLQIGGSQIPWRFIALPPESHLNIVVSLLENEPNVGDIGITVTNENNQEAETLLSYLILGNNRAAKVVGDKFVERLLADEGFNTLEATIGGYYLLKIGDDERLAQWVKKFVNLIQWLPDILVIHSWFLLREDDVQRVKLARSRLLEAIKQGIPIYNEGMRLLFDGLLLFHQDALTRHEQDLEIEQALELIRDYATATDCSKTLTTFYGADPELLTEPRIPREVVNQLSLPLGAPDLMLIRLQPDATEDNFKMVINGVYKHVLGNHYLMESERLKEAEQLLRDYRITVREFISILANSQLYRRLFFYSSSQLRFIELNYKHLLGRAPYDQSEIIEHVNLYNSKGYEAEINSYIYSQEYTNYFGNWIVPYYRGFLSEPGSRTVGFTRMFKLYRGYAVSDLSQIGGNSSRLVSDLALNQASPIIVPGRNSFSNLTIYKPGQLYRIEVAVARINYLKVRRINQAVVIPYEQISEYMQRLHSQGGKVISINPVPN